MEDYTKHSIGALYEEVRSKLKANESVIVVLKILLTRLESHGAVILDTTRSDQERMQAAKTILGIEDGVQFIKKDAQIIRANLHTDKYQDEDTKDLAHNLFIWFDAAMNIYFP